MLKTSMVIIGIILLATLVSSFTWEYQKKTINGEFLITPVIVEKVVEIGSYKALINTTYFDTNTSQVVTIRKNQTMPIHVNVTLITYPKENTYALHIWSQSFDKTFNLSKDYTYSYKNEVITVKDLRRGGSWNDHDLDTCYNPGVPCRQFNISNPLNRQTIAQYSDYKMEIGDLLA